MISDSGHEVDALGHVGDEGRKGHERVRLAANKAFDPHVSEWGNPVDVTVYYLHLSKVGCESIRRELKHLSTSRKRNQARDTLSSGERNG